ncbi:hypothetical protein [Aneurinibacillus danicus]|uniref:Uncharacterized protein n=1 Tax=Aneurinibacillus danicus TaxID=267746 RepID=A0A511V4E2_9BACL|nr:hypothetical protein [Aneurinibacillus danicus]GEN33787.1 hypothetical protein ADA01nite_12470 [Aneurinibacillus danicus]
MCLCAQSERVCFLDIETNEEYKIDTDQVKASFAFLAPIEVVIEETLLNALLAAALTVVVGGMTYTLVTEVASTLRKKQYEHYAAVLSDGELYIGSAISYETAKWHLGDGLDTHM